jgi:hypothetical protein
VESGKTIDINAKIVRNQEIVFSGMDSDTVMMSIEMGEYYGTNPVGGRIWELLEQPRTPAGICDILMEEYNVPAEECRRDVLEFIGQMFEKKLVKYL